MLAWHQKEGNNIETTDGKTPNYNTKCGWAEGAQTDIFSTSSSTPAPIANSSSITAQPSQTAAVNETSVVSLTSASAVQTLSTVVVVNDVSTMPVSTLTSAPAQSALPTGALPAQTYIGVPWKFRHHRRPRPTGAAQA
jgi:hypothetical protein